MRFAVLSVFVALMFVAQVSALETDIKSLYQPKETMILKITGDIAGTISAGQIFFKRNNIFVPIEYDVARVGNDWYAWAIAPENENNYTFIIEGVENSAGQTENYQKDFSVSGSTKEYNVKPGFAISNDDFNIELEVNDNVNHDIEIDFPSSKTVAVSSGTNNIEFDVDKTQSSKFVIIKVGDYSIPAYVPSSSTSQTNQTTGQNQTGSVFVISPRISVSPSYVQKYLYQNNQEKTYAFTVTNENNLSYKNLQIIFNKSLFDTEDQEFDLKANGNYSFDLILNKNANGNINEKIYINGTNISVGIPIFLRLTDNATNVAAFYGELVSNGTNGTIRRTSQLCSEFGASVCSTGSVCSGEALEGRDGSCCLGICQQPAGNSYAWVGWLIALVVLGVGWFAYYKYKKAGTE